MKTKQFILSSLILITSISLGYSASTYVWNGSGTFWTISTNWTPNRITPASDDILQFNDGSTYSVYLVPNQTIGKLLVTNSTNITLSAGAASNVLTISGGAGNDLFVGSGSQLNYSGTDAFIISLSTAAIGLILGSMTLSNITGTPAYKLLATDESSLVFANGSVITCGPHFSGNAFGIDNLNSIIFQSGSTYVCRGGSGPFGAGVPNSVVVFQPGSLYRHERSEAPSVSGRTYANFELNLASFNGSSTGSSPVNIDNLTVTACTNFNLNLTGGINIKGDLTVNSGNLNFTPASAGNVTFCGSSPQTITISESGNINFDTNSILVINTNYYVRNRPHTRLDPMGLCFIKGSIVLESSDINVLGSVTGTPSLVYTGSGVATGIGNQAILRVKTQTPTSFPSILSTLILEPGSGNVIDLPNDVVVNDTLIAINGAIRLNGNDLTLSDGISISGALEYIMNGVGILYCCYVGFPGEAEMIWWGDDGYRPPFIPTDFIDIMHVECPLGLVLPNDLKINELDMINGFIDLNGYKFQVNNSNIALTDGIINDLNITTESHVINGVTGYPYTWHINGSGTSTIDFFFEPGSNPFMGTVCFYARPHSGGSWSQAGVYTAVNLGDGLYKITVDNFGLKNSAKGDNDYTITNYEDGFVPVELSSFSAVLTAQNYVMLQWTTQTETNVSGYYIYRNTENNLTAAINISLLITATNTSQETNYIYIDNEVSIGSTYYYWLQNRDMDGQTHFYGPISATVTNNGSTTPPIIVTKTALLDAYPNPFNPMTVIPYSIKDAVDVTIEIYNVKGQIIRTFTATHNTKGYYKVAWDGKNNEGKPCSSGIYYYRMTSGKYNSSKKAVLLK